MVLCVAGAGCDGLLAELDPDDLAGPVGDEPCTARELGEDDELTYLSAYRLDEGRVTGLCLGEDEPSLVDTWETLTTIAPPEMLEEITVLGGVASNEIGDDETLAFVSALDDEGTAFQMSFTLEETEGGGEEVLVTMVHEFSHVFTGTPDQLDRTIPPEDCGTFDSGEGCYREGAYVLGWIDAFWSDGELDGFDPTDEPVPADGEERCEADAGFLGPYAASSPEEDFAESFAAFVLEVDPGGPARAARLAWFEDHPELVAVRDNAVAAGLTPVTYEFDVCGS